MVQAGLVAFDDQDVVGAPTEQVLGVGPLGVQGVGGDDRIGDRSSNGPKALISLVFASTTHCPRTTPRPGR